MPRLRFRCSGKQITASSAARAGILAASANVAPTFARTLLPRSVSDQAAATGICAAAIFQIGATVHAAAETIALYRTGTHGMRGRTPDRGATIAADLLLAGTGAMTEKLLPQHRNETLAVAILRTTADCLLVGGVSGTLSELSDLLLRTMLPAGKGEKRSILIDVALGVSITTGMVGLRHKRAREFGVVDPKRRAVKRAGAIATAKAIGIGIASGTTIMVVASTEQWVANSVRHLVDVKLKRFDVASPLLGHSIALAGFGVVGAFAFSLVKRQVEDHGDIVEPAYQKPVLNPFVSTGPRSTVGFDEIGKEGRRFVLMALSAAEITEVLGETAIDPIRVINPYQPMATTQERAQACLREMEAVGAFDRHIICIASPTGVGYVSYTFAESLEYLTRGDCAIVVPEYALVPSALALFDTHDGVLLQRKVIELVRDRIRSMPPNNRPRLVQFGESLGAQVALDVCYPAGSASYSQLGLEAGLYLGVPFRSKAWISWSRRPHIFDPAGNMAALSEPERIETIPEQLRNQIRHFMIVHDDDPVNKFSYRLLVSQPWWLGPPATRPPKVPRETMWRPIITFVLMVVDLKNGMEFKPGEFHRRGHDYRIDARAATALAFQLSCSDEQAQTIEAALRQREKEWATRRLIARKLAVARESILRTLRSWGVKASSLSTTTDGFPIIETADINPRERTLGHHLDSSVLS